VHGPVPRPDLGLGRGLDRRLLRTPERSEEQGLVRVKEQSPEQMLFRATGQGLERRPLRRPEPAPERGLGRTSLQEPEQRLQRVLERGPVWGQGLPQPYGGWEHRGNSKCKVQNDGTDGRERTWRGWTRNDEAIQSAKCKVQIGRSIGRETTWEPTNDDGRRTKSRSMLRFGLAVPLISVKGAL